MMADLLFHEYTSRIGWCRVSLRETILNDHELVVVMAPTDGLVQKESTPVGKDRDIAVGYFQRQCLRQKAQMVDLLKGLE